MIAKTAGRARQHDTRQVETGHQLLTVPRWATMVSLTSAAGAVSLCFVLLLLALEDEVLTESGGSIWLVALLGAVVMVPLFMLLMVIASAAIGVIVTLFDRLFSFRRLLALTFCTAAAALLATSAGASALLQWDLSAGLVIVAVGALHLCLAAAYTVALVKLAGVSRRPAVVIGAALGMLVLTSVIVGASSA